MKYDLIYVKTLKTQVEFTRENFHVENLRCQLQVLIAIWWMFEEQWKKIFSMYLRRNSLRIWNNTLVLWRAYFIYCGSNFNYVLTWFSMYHCSLILCFAYAINYNPTRNSRGKNTICIITFLYGLPNTVTHYVYIIHHQYNSPL